MSLNTGNNMFGKLLHKGMKESFGLLSHINIHNVQFNTVRYGKINTKYTVYRTHVKGMPLGFTNNNNYF